MQRSGEGPWSPAQQRQVSGSRGSLLLQGLIKEIHRVTKAGWDCPNQIYNSVTFQMGNWDRGRWRDLSGPCYQQVSELWSRRTDCLGICSVISQCPFYFTLDLLPAIPFQLVPDLDQATVLASVLPFGYTDSVGFPWHFWSGFCLELNASGGVSSWQPWEGLLLHRWLLLRLLLLPLLTPPPPPVQLLLCQRSRLTL